jgi:copper chaperone CopZ
MGRLTETIEIEGMTCGKCAYHVRQALQGVQGVEVENVEIGSAEISYDPENINRSTIITAIKEEGYTVV